MTDERKRLNKSRADVARACGNTSQAIGQFERGTSLPGGAVLAGYARIGADVQYILTGVRSPTAGMIAEQSTPYGAAPPDPPDPLARQKALLKILVDQCDDADLLGDIRAIVDSLNRQRAKRRSAR